ncbi:MAG: Uma2 family endonuclease [Rubrivivax sp.]
MSAVRQSKMTLQEYLDWEDEQVEKHEYWAGEIFAMVGGRRVHGRLVGNLMRRLSDALHGSPCQVFAETMKLQIGVDKIVYPDIFVTCDKADLSTDQIFRAPTVVVEVLSPSTQAYDRSKKFAAYRRIPSLREYLLIDPDTRRVESFRPGSDGLWDLHDQSESDTLEIPSIDCRVSIADLWDGVDPAPAD